MSRPHRRTRKSARLLEDVSRWADRIGVSPDRVYVQRMKRKWASCSGAGRLYFSADLSHEPALFRDAVIVHELLHLRIQNHGKLFKSLLNSLVPEWEAATKGKAGRVCR